MSQLEFSPISPQEQQKLWVYAVHFQTILPHVRFLTYMDIERDCLALAGLIRARFEDAEIKRWHVVGIPRGGLIVAGMVGYALDLAHKQLRPSMEHSETVAPICIIDDCALTGVRIKETLALYPGRQVIFAHLYSHPQLRANITTQEKQVAACLAVHDLETLPQGDEDPHQAQFTHGRYFSRPLPPVIFPWGGPSLLVVDPFSGKLEDGWRFGEGRPTLKSLAHHHFPTLTGERAEELWRGGEHLVIRRAEGALWLLNLDTTTGYKLAGAAAEIWTALAAGNTLAALAPYWNEINKSVEPEQLRQFIEELVAHGLIQPAA